MNTGERLQKVRADQGKLSQKEFAQRLGVSQSKISRLEKKADRPPDGKLVRKIAEVFNVNPDWLLNEQGEQYRRVERLEGKVGMFGKLEEVSIVKEIGSPSLSYGLTPSERSVVEAILGVLRGPRSDELEMVLCCFRMALARIGSTGQSPPSLSADDPKSDWKVNLSGPCEPEEKKKTGSE